MSLKSVLRLSSMAAIIFFTRFLCIRLTRAARLKPVFKHQAARFLRWRKRLPVRKGQARVGAVAEPSFFEGGEEQALSYVHEIYILFSVHNWGTFTPLLVLTRFIAPIVSAIPRRA